MIICEFTYCIYNKKNECILSSISVSPLGYCDDCLIPDIPDESLEKFKLEALAKIEQRKINIKSKAEKN